MARLANLIVPLDFSQVSDAALARAIGLGRELKATLHLVHAILPFDLSGFRHEFARSLENRDWARIHKQAEEDLDAAATKVRNAGVFVTKTLAEDAPVSAIENTYRDKQGDLIVMGTHGFSGFKHLTLGSVAERTLRHVHAPVYCVKGTETSQSDPIRRVLVPTDFSEPAGQAAAFAVELAFELSAAVEVVHVMHPLNMVAAPYAVPLSTDYLLAVRAAAQKQIEEARDELAREGVKIDVFVAEGSAPEVICERAKGTHADLIVMGTHGHTGVKHVLFGSIAERVVRTAPCSVLTVNPQPASSQEAT